MHIEQRKYSIEKGWETFIEGPVNIRNSCTLVLAFGSRKLLEDGRLYDDIRNSYPDADIVLASTSGEIIGTEVNDDTISLTAIAFDTSTILAKEVAIADVTDIYEAGRALGGAIPGAGLKSLFVISDGHNVNGSELVAGLNDSLPQTVVLTGGLAGDGADFKKTLVGLNGYPAEGKIVGIGFYGDKLVVSSGSMGGWDPFGPYRLITRSQDNILYELDHEPALDIYKKYLGEFADELPGAALRFPLNIRTDGDDHSLVRTILSINEEEKSLTFAGNMPEGAYAQLMKANYDRLIDGASGAARHSVKNETHTPDIAILISCVGRKLVLGHRVEEEVDAVRELYGNDTILTGFYSYGEIAPSFEFMKCELHNQTMTITTLTELNE